MSGDNVGVSATQAQKSVHRVLLACFSMLGTPNAKRAALVLQLRAPRPPGTPGLSARRHMQPLHGRAQAQAQLTHVQIEPSLNTLA